MKHIHTLYVTVVASVITPFIAFAQFSTGGPYYGGIGGGYSVGVPNYAGAYGGGGFGYQTRSARFGDIESLIMLAQTLLGYAQVFVFIVALFFFMSAAFKFVKGDAAGGGKMLQNAVIGLVVALLAFSIIPLLCFLVGSTGGRACAL